MKYKAAAFDCSYKLWVLQIAVTLPITSASCESFSKMNLVKTFLRNFTTGERLSNTDLLSIEGVRASDSVTRVTNFGDSDSTGVTLRQIVTRLKSRFSQNESTRLESCRREILLSLRSQQGTIYWHLIVV